MASGTRLLCFNLHGNACKRHILPRYPCLKHSKRYITTRSQLLHFLLQFSPLFPKLCSLPRSVIRIMSGTLDLNEFPFFNIPGYQDQLSCAQACENFLAFNGCSTPKCFCSPENFIPGGEKAMATCLSTFCSSSQVAAAETFTASVFSAYCASKGFTNLAQATPASSSSTSSSTAISTSSSSPTSLGKVASVQFSRG